MNSKIVYYDDKAKSSLMENQPIGDFEVAFYDKSFHLRFTNKKVEVKSSNNEKTCYDLSKLPESLKQTMDYANSMYLKLCDLEKQSNVTFPLIIQHPMKPSMTTCRMTTMPHDRLMSSKESLSGYFVVPKTVKLLKNTHKS